MALIAVSPARKALNNKWTITRPAQVVSAFNFAHSTVAVCRMPTIPLHFTWRRLRKHTDVNRTIWDASEARRRSGQPDGAALYNPYLYHSNPQIETLERRCIETGIVISDTGNFASCYLLVAGGPVGACSGEFTNYVYAEMYGGTYHGYPISPSLLKKRLRQRGLSGP